jgi:hypothetical protein
MLRLFRLLLRPIERFLAQWISISTEPSAFVRERIRLGDTTNFLRAGGFFFCAVSTAFLAELAIVQLLGIGDIIEPYYWLLVLLASIPVVLFCYLLLRLVADLTLKDVLHLLMYPGGAAIFAGASLSLVTSAVVVLLVTIGYIPKVSFDFSQWGEGEQMIAVSNRLLHECQKRQSFIYSVLTSAFQETYGNLKPPIDKLPWLRPVVSLIYVFVAATVFMTAVGRSKAIVFGTVVLAYFLATATSGFALALYLDWNVRTSSCARNLLEASLDRVAESALKDFAAAVNRDALIHKDAYDLSVRAEGRVLSFKYYFKEPIPTIASMEKLVGKLQRDDLENYCAREKQEDGYLRNLKATVTRTFYTMEGTRLTGFSISPADCPQW